MADDSGDRDAASGLPRDAQAALAVLGAASRDEADSFLRKQSALADLQIEQLRINEQFERSHMRWRRLNDQLKGAMQIVVVLIGALIVAGIGAAMWNASQMEGLVVEAFSVPPSFAQEGITGEVVADNLTGKITAIHDIANVNSIARSKDVRQEGEEIKVEIPETGISLSQAWRYLRLWLGHERQLSGHVRLAGGGRIALDIALDGETFTFEGAAGALDALEQQAAEWVFATVDPINIVWYLADQDRFAESMAAAERNTRIVAGGSPVDRAGSFSLWAAATYAVAGDPRLAMARARIGREIDPNLATPHLEIMQESEVLGHDEDVLGEARIIRRTRRQDQQKVLQGNGFSFVLEKARFWELPALGDFSAAMAEPCDHVCSFAELLLRRAEYAARLHDPVGARALAAKAQAVGAPQADATRARYFIAMAERDWRGAAAAARAYGAALQTDNAKHPSLAALALHTKADPLLAEALARGEDFAGAHAAIDGTPPDCYACVRARGVVRAAERNWGAAAYWFADAVGQAPSLPFAYADWGAMLLAKGDTEGAIAKFAAAHDKSPHYADALELWGEALRAQGHAELAAAKFTQAAQIAPAWDRLHIKP